MADQWNQAAEDQFRHDAPSFVEDLKWRRKLMSTLDAQHGACFISRGAI
jgi:hypothetical protein